ncbi:GNAT family N-acetyltransferase [Bacillus sp. S14(2024)]|uniref:GNAT family N-acetyltransferase n=1 Tax=Bacillus sp. S14(2024) TaxID=3162884 RepID=UPI003D21EBF5
MLTFRHVNVEKDKQMLIKFFTDTDEGEELEFNEGEYIKYAKQKQLNFPEGFVLLENDQQTVGELVLRYDSYEGREIGYVSFVYVIPEGRGKGYSNGIFQYAENQFKKRNVFEYHLRVAQSNLRAIKFYEKQGLVIIGEERNSYNQRCWRMGKKM